MKVEVSFLPEQLRCGPEDACVVIDAVRAGASLVAMAEAGDPVVYLAPGAAAARAYRDAHAPDAILGGESGGLAPDGFDLGNSPEEWLQLDLAGRTVVFGTTNGTAAATACQKAAHVFFGCFLNATSAADAAGGTGCAQVMIACAGSSGAFALDDAVCAGVICRRLIECGAEPEDSALAAMAIAEKFPDVSEMLRISESGRRLIQVGLEKDLDFCAKLDWSRRVPALAKAGITAHRRLLTV